MAEVREMANYLVKSGGRLVGMSVITLVFSISGYAIEARLHETYQFESNSVLILFFVGLICGFILLIWGSIMIKRGYNIDAKVPEQIQQEPVQVRQKLCPKCDTDITFLVVCPNCGHVIKTKEN